MLLIRAFGATALLAATLCVFAVAAESGTLKSGDRIVFFGDSITWAGSGPEGYISIIRETLEKKRRDKDVEFINAGVSGDRVPDLKGRVENDVIARKPAIVFIYIGINDVWHFSLLRTGTPKDRYESGLREIIGKIAGAGARVILCTPSVIGEKRHGSNQYDAMLDEYAGISRKTAKDLNVRICDLRKAFIEYLKVNNPENKEIGILTSDGVHLNNKGNKLVAEQMLKALVE